MRWRSEPWSNTPRRCSSTRWRPRRCRSQSSVPPCRRSRGLRSGGLRFASLEVGSVAKMDQPGGSIHRFRRAWSCKISGYGGYLGGALPEHGLQERGHVFWPLPAMPWAGIGHCSFVLVMQGWQTPDSWPPTSNLSGQKEPQP